MYDIRCILYTVYYAFFPFLCSEVRRRSSRSWRPARWSSSTRCATRCNVAAGQHRGSCVRAFIACYSGVPARQRWNECKRWSDFQWKNCHVLKVFWKIWILVWIWCFKNWNPRAGRPATWDFIPRSCSVPCWRLNNWSHGWPKGPQSSKMRSWIPAFQMLTVGIVSGYFFATLLRFPIIDRLSWSCTVLCLL